MNSRLLLSAGVAALLVLPTVASAQVTHEYQVDSRRYREASGGAAGNIQCFNGWSLEKARRACDNNRQCVGFSYGRSDGQNHRSGCLKKNHNAGWNNNKNYDGYTKTRQRYQRSKRKYREAAGGAGGNITCFDGWSLEKAQRACSRNRKCAGFSYGRRDGKNRRSGCLKNNHNAGWNNNPNYDGYTKLR